MDDDFAQLVKNLPADTAEAAYLVLEYLNQQDLVLTDGQDDEMYLYVVKELFAELNWTLPGGQASSVLQEASKKLGALRGRRLMAAREVNASKNEGLNFGYAFLSSEDRVKIHELLEQVRRVIEASGLSDRKKSELFKRLAALELDVDRDGTSSDRFMAFAADLAATAGEMAENAKPAIEQFKDVLRIIMRRRAEDEGAQLPPPEDVFVIELEGK